MRYLRFAFGFGFGATFSVAGLGPGRWRASVRPNFFSSDLTNAGEPKGLPVCSLAAIALSSAGVNAVSRAAFQFFAASSTGFTSTTPSLLPLRWAVALDQRHSFGFAEGLVRAGAVST